MIKNFRLKQLLGWLLLAGGLWLSDGWGWWDWVKRPVASLTQPLRGRWYQVKQGEVEVNELGLETTAWQAEIERLRQENEQLRKLLGAPLPASWQFVPAQVLQLDERGVVIDEGSDGGIKVGNMVMVLATTDEIKGGVVIGRVAEVGPRQARVDQLSRVESGIKVRTEAGVRGLVRPVADEQGLRLDQVLQKDQLNLGELILTTGGDGWRPGLVIGRVGEIEKVETAVYQQAEVVELVPIELVSRLWVVKD